MTKQWKILIGWVVAICGVEANPSTDDFLPSLKDSFGGMGPTVIPADEPLIQHPTYHTSGRRLTLNKMGWEDFQSDFPSEAFIEGAGPLTTCLEVGGGTGYMAAKAAEKGGYVWLNDLSPEHTRLFWKRPEVISNPSHITTHTGDFVDSASLPCSYFNAILARRVLHFFEPDRLKKAAAKLCALLKKEGRVYVVVETPYLKNWETFIPIYEENKKKGLPFPGFCDTPAKYNPLSAQNLPQTMHFLDPEVLSTVFSEAGFIIEKVEYINRQGQYPEAMCLDGRESVGLIALKK
jgi:SAM-dependent methyltransferase